MSQETLTKFVPVFDGANFLEWEAQMKAYLMEKGYWRVVDGTLTRPAAAGDPQTAWDLKDEMANGSLILRLAHNHWCHVGHHLD